MIYCCCCQICIHQCEFYIVYFAKYCADTRQHSSVAFFLGTPSTKVKTEWINWYIYFSSSHISHMMFSVFFVHIFFFSSFNWSIRVHGCVESRLIWLHQYSFYGIFQLLLLCYSLTTMEYLKRERERKIVWNGHCDGRKNSNEICSP